VTSSRSDRLQLLDALRERVVVADGAMGTMLQAHELDVDADFQGHEGCNEILNVTRPDVVRGVHDAYFEVGCDAVETNTFGSNWAGLARVRHRRAASSRRRWPVRASRARRPTTGPPRATAPLG
jgi:methionine synthase I (cobalamin-dependent)